MGLGLASERAPIGPDARSLGSCACRSCARMATGSVTNVTGAAFDDDCRGACVALDVEVELGTPVREAVSGSVQPPRHGDDVDIVQRAGLGEFEFARGS